MKSNVQRVPLKFEGGSFEPINFFLEIFFYRKFWRKPENHRFDQAIGETGQINELGQHPHNLIFYY